MHIVAFTVQMVVFLRLKQEEEWIFTAPFILQSIQPRPSSDMGAMDAGIHALSAERIDFFTRRSKWIQKSSECFPSEFFS